MINITMKVNNNYNNYLNINPIVYYISTSQITCLLFIYVTFSVKEIQAALAALVKVNILTKSDRKIERNIFYMPVSEKEDRRFRGKGKRRY